MGQGYRWALLIQTKHDRLSVADTKTLLLATNILIPQRLIRRNWVPLLLPDCELLVL